MATVVICKSCGWYGDFELCSPSSSPYHDMACLNCGSTNMDTSKVNAQWKAEGRVYGFGDNNTLAADPEVERRLMERQTVAVAGHLLDRFDLTSSRYNGMERTDISKARVALDTSVKLLRRAAALLVNPCNSQVCRTDRLALAMEIGVALGIKPGMQESCVTGVVTPAADTAGTGTLELMARLQEAERQAELWRAEHTRFCRMAAEMAGLPMEPYPGYENCLAKIREMLNAKMGSGPAAPAPQG